MAADIQQRLESWREVVRTGRPDWLADVATKIVRELEDELHPNPRSPQNAG